MNLLAMPVLLGLFGAGATLLLGRRPRVQRAVSVLTLAGMAAVAGVLMWKADTEGVLTLWVGGWPTGLGIVLVADRFTGLMLLIAALVTLGVLIYSTGLDHEEVRRETPVSIFHPTFLLLCAGVANAFLAGDLFNLFVGFEILLFASYVLLTMGGTGERIRAGTTYVVVSLLSSSLFLIAIAVTYAATGTVNLAELAVRIPDLSSEVQVLLQVLLLVVFAIKAAVFPLSAWLPDSYPTAPAPVTAVFAGLLTKVGVYAIVRTQTLLFPHRPLSTVILIFAGLTMIVGIMGAIAQSELKRMLSFTLVSHIGYMLMGVGLATVAGFSGAIFYTSHHITIQSALFLVAGLVALIGGTTSLETLNGLSISAPLVGVLFFVPAMNLAGIPPFSGFIGKYGLLQAAVDIGTPIAWILVAASVVTSLLTLYAMAKAWNRAFWGAPRPLAAAAASESGEEIQTSHKVMIGATAGLITLSLALTVFAGPLYDYTTRAGKTLLSDAYQVAVLSEGGNP